MRKTDKKIDNAIIAALTETCETAKETYTGFQWLTHFVNWSAFPKSLVVVCIFDTNSHLSNADVSGFRATVKHQLSLINIHIGDANKQIRFDTEENCDLHHNGNWDNRFSGM
ncbi:Uncharacterised protein [BD1-7 clade bacterium]|uniref:Fis family transcriptional regulator n=1 Tax=BD1-7 clade bacterium TaxID=2029982 RepID=A0A5S9R1F9_9GAMM|nr:Uncharacterised protein [BD1-7 clade bacterium]